jgi:hypothetical protein
MRVLIVATPTFADSDMLTGQLGGLVRYGGGQAIDLLLMREDRTAEIVRRLAERGADQGLTAMAWNGDWSLDLCLAFYCLGDEIEDGDLNYFTDVTEHLGVPTEAWATPLGFSD